MMYIVITPTTPKVTEVDIIAGLTQSSLIYTKTMCDTECKSVLTHTNVHIIKWYIHIKGTGDKAGRLKIVPLENNNKQLDIDIEHRINIQLIQIDMDKGKKGISNHGLNSLLNLETNI